MYGNEWAKSPLFFQSYCSKENLKIWHTTQYFYWEFCLTLTENYSKGEEYGVPGKLLPRVFSPSHACKANHSLFQTIRKDSYIKSWSWLDVYKLCGTEIFNISTKLENVKLIFSYKLLFKVTKLKKTARIEKHIFYIFLFVSLIVVIYQNNVIASTLWIQENTNLYTAFWKIIVICFIIFSVRLYFLSSYLSMVRYGIL